MERIGDAPVIKRVFEGECASVFLATDEKFLPHAMTAVASIAENADSNKKYDMIILGSGLPKEKVSAALAWAARYPFASLRFLDTTSLMEHFGSRLFQATGVFSLATYFRLFAPALFHEYDKIIYMDADMVAVDDIAKLHDVDLGSSLLAACHDHSIEDALSGAPDSPFARYVRDKLGLMPDDGYFNAGLLVLNVAVMRNENMLPSFLLKLAELGKPRMHDQDILNSVCRGRVLFLECDWNYFHWYADPGEESASYWRLADSSKAAIRKHREDFKIVHFVGTKPWRAGYLGNVDHLYWKYSALSPFHDIIKAQFGKQMSMGNLLFRIILMSVHDLRSHVIMWMSNGEKKERYRERAHQFRLQRKALFHRLRQRNAFCR